MLAVLRVLAFICVMIAWFAIIFTGRYPRALFDFVLGVGRWGLRVSAYMWLLITDEYRPFSLRWPQRGAWPQGRMLPCRSLE